MRAVVGLVAVAVLLAGCGGDEAPDVPGPTPDTPTTPEVTTPPPDEVPDGVAPPPTTPDEVELGAWNRLSDAPLALTEVAAAAVSGQIWVAGGLDARGQASAAVLVYAPDFDTWEVGPELPAAVHHAALVATDNTVYLIGGYEGSGFNRPRATVLLLDQEAGGWVEGPALPAPRAAGAAAWDGTQIIYGGGVGPGGLTGDVLALRGRSWEPVGALSEAREHLAAASDGQGRVWFLGGRTGGLDTNLTAVDVVEGGVVRRVGDLPTARGGLAGFWLDGLGGCAVGGEAPDGTFADVECVTAEGVVNVLSPLVLARHGLGAAVVDGIVYTLLGGPDPGLAVSAAVEALPPR